MPLVQLSTLSLAHEGNARPIESLAFSKDGKALFVGRYPTLFVVRVADGAIIDEIDVSVPPIDTGIEGDDYSERVRSVVESPDGATLYVLCETMVNNSGDMFGWVQAHARDAGERLWMVPDIDDPQVEPPIDEEAGISFVLPMPDGTQVALCSTLGVTFVDARTAKRRAVIEWDADPDDEEGQEPYDHLSAAVCSPDGSQLWLAWPPELRCYDSKSKKLVRRIDFTDVSVAVFDAGPWMSVRPSDGRVTMMRADRSMLVVANAKDSSASVTVMNASTAPNEQTLAVLALVEHGDRWVRAERNRSEELFVGPIATESREAIRVLEEPDGAPTQWNQCAVHEGSSLVIARALGSTLWAHRVVED